MGSQYKLAIGKTLENIEAFVHGSGSLNNYNYGESITLDSNDEIVGVVPFVAVGGSNKVLFVVKPVA